MRASSLDRALQCPASMSRPDGEIIVEGSGKAADMGTAFHLYMAWHVSRKWPLPPPLPAADVDTEELGWLCSQGRKLWDAVREWLPEPHVEEYMHEPGPVALTGTPDIFSVAGRQLRIADWKTEFAERDHTEQLRAYAYLGLQRYPECDTAWTMVLMPRTGEYIPQETAWTRADLDRWYSQAVKRLETEAYNPGECCTYCPRALACPAKQVALRNALGIVSAAQLEGTMALLSDGQLVSLHEQRKIAEKFISEVGDIIKAEVANRGGRVKGADGNALEIAKETVKKLDTVKAWPILLEVIGNDALVAASKLSREKVEKAIMKVAPKRQGGAMIKQTMEELDAAGALPVEERELLRVRKSIKEIPEGVS